MRAFATRRAVRPTLPDTIGAVFASAGNRLRQHGASIVQAAVAAAISSFIAANLLGHQRAFFAPIAAIIALNLGPGRRTSRAFELVVGIGLGILVGEAWVTAVGFGTLQLGTAVLLAMLAAVALGGRPLFVSQAAVSAVLVVALEPSLPGSAVARFADAVIGGAVGLAVLALATRDPLAGADRTTKAASREIGATLESLSAALSAHDAAKARRAMVRALRFDDVLADVQAAMDLATDRLRLRRRSPSGRTLDRYRVAVSGLELAADDVRAVCRAAVRALDLEPAIPVDVAIAVGQLALATKALPATLRTGEEPRATRDAARTAAQMATRSGGGRPSMPIGALVGQIRSTATDLLRASGLPDDEAVATVRETDGARPGLVAGPREGEHASNV